MTTSRRNLRSVWLSKMSGDELAERVVIVGSHLGHAHASLYNSLMGRFPSHVARLTPHDFPNEVEGLLAAWKPNRQLEQDTWRKDLLCQKRAASCAHIS